MYYHYKPLRNFLREYETYSGLMNVWDCMSRIGNRDPRYKSDAPTNKPYDWELEILAREIVLNCRGGIVPTNNADIRFNIHGAVNHLRRISEAISKDTIKSPEDALRSVHSLIHQQIPWQDDDTFYRVTRYAKIMKFHKLQHLVEIKLGILIRDLYKLGLAVAGALVRDPRIRSTAYSLTPGIEPGAEKTFFNLVAADLDWLRLSTKKEQIYDHRWAYTFNPLRGKPLVFDTRQPDLLIGISEKLLMWRITDGVYYDIMHLKGFSDAWGAAFENYIGDILKAALPASVFNILPEQPYYIKRSERHDGADWRISDLTGHAFIECKTKRLTIEAKTDFNGVLLSDELDTLAEFFIQNYKNIQDARDKLVPNFAVNDLPVYCVVVTLENWRTEHPLIEDELKALILQKLVDNHLPLSIIDDCPYRLCNAQQFEKHIQDVARQGINSAFGPGSEFKKGPYQNLFPGTLTELIPELTNMPNGIQL